MHNPSNSLSYSTYLMLILTALTALFSSCKKERVINPEPETPKTLAATQIINSNGHSILSSYSYNSRGKIYQEELKDETSGATLYQVYRFKNAELYASEILNDDKKLSRMNYTYTNGKLAKITYLEYDQYQNTSLLFEQELEYEGQQIYQIRTRNSAQNISSYTRFQFQQGNITESRNYSGDGRLQQTIKLEYDQKINPYYGHYNKIAEPMGYNKSNITKITLLDDKGIVVSEQEYSYAYNSSNQPIAQYKKGSPTQQVISFIYQ